MNGSAVGFYGDGGQMLLDEREPAGPGFMAGLCAAWEAEAARMTALGVRVCVLRLGLVFDWTRRHPADAGAAGAVRPWRADRQGRQWAPWITATTRCG